MRAIEILKSLKNHPCPFDNELLEKENLIYQQIINSASENNLKLPVYEAFQGLRDSYEERPGIHSVATFRTRALRQQGDCAGAQTTGTG